MQKPHKNNDVGVVASGAAAGVAGDVSIRDENAMSGTAKCHLKSNDGSTHNQSQFCAQCHGLVH